MTTANAFWRDPEFHEFITYIKATAAGDKRHYAHPRFDLKSNTPSQIVRKALDYRAECAACGARIAPFRQRKGGSGIYLGATCEQDRNNACSRGRKATLAYDVIWELIRLNDQQGRLI